MSHHEKEVTFARTTMKCPDCNHMAVIVQPVCTVCNTGPRPITCCPFCQTEFIFPIGEQPDPDQEDLWHDGN